MNIKGMDVEAVGRMATQLTEAAQEIQRIRDELTQSLEAVDWTGPDADRFRSNWTGEMVPAMDEISTAVDELATTAQTNASEQQATSS